MLRPFLKHLAATMGLPSPRDAVNWRRKLRVRGATVIIPSIRGIRCDLSETWMIGLLDALLPKKGGAFLDVGANLGQTLIKVKALAPARKYVGFEPNPVCVFYLDELIRANRFQDCTVFPVALFTDEAVLRLDFFHEGPCDPSASVIADFRPGQAVRRSIFVPAFRFERLAASAEIGDIGFIKIDVEGAELEVVRSLMGVIRARRPIILVEILPAYSAENTRRIERQKELEAIFLSERFALFRVEKTAKGEFAQLRKIESIGIHPDLDRCDYVLIPEELDQ